jgi:trk system potassium uptake protein TrkA
MKVCIIGTGVVGSYLAKELSKENHEIAVLDKDLGKLEKLKFNYDLLTVNCNALSLECLEKVKDFDLFIIVTESDEKNLAISLLLKSILKKEKIIVRVSNEAFSLREFRTFLKVETINVFSEVKDVILNLLKYPFALSVVELEGEVLIFKYSVTLDDFLAGKRISELKELRDRIDFTIVAVERENEVILPSGKNFMYPEDNVYIATRKENVFNLVKSLKISFSPIKSVFVLGYSKACLEILSLLSQQENLKVKYAFHDKKICEEISGMFPKFLVLHGDFLDEEFLKEEGIENSSLVISCGESESENILSATLCKKLGAKKVCSLISRPEYEKLAQSIGIDVPIIPRKLLASKVYRTLSKRGILDVLELSKDLDIVELKVDSSLVGKKVMEIEKPFLIVAIKRGNEVFLAKGDTELFEGDVIIFVEKKR